MFGDKTLPPGFIKRKAYSEYVLAEPAGPGFDSDMFCQLLYTPWWIWYQHERLQRFLKPRKNLLDPEMSKDFTRYLDPTTPNSHPYAPVEAFDGEVFLPTSLGWRKGFFGCDTSCQDLTKTIEWIMALEIEKNRQVRARAGSSFMCRPGLIAVTETAASRREPETQAEIDVAFRTLARRIPTKTDAVSLHGRTGTVTKCKCVEPTSTTFHQLDTLEKKEGLKGTSKRLNSRRNRMQRLREPAALPVGEPQLKRGRMGKEQYKARVGCNRPLDNQASSPEDAEEDIDLRIEDFMVDDAGPSTSTCHDYHFPELPDTQPIGTIHRVDHVQPGEAQRIGDMLQAALELCTGIEIPPWEFGSNGNQPPGDPKQKGH